MYGFFADFMMKHGTLIQTSINIAALRRGDPLIYETVAYMPDGSDLTIEQYESSWFAEQGHAKWAQRLQGN
jgi:hypothetical protein